MNSGVWPAIPRRQSPPSPLPRLQALAADECVLWMKTVVPAKPPRPLVGAAEAAPQARDPEARRHYWTGHYFYARSKPASISSVCRRWRPVNILLLIVPSGWLSRSASSDCVNPP
jgi:hypothetical protein